MEDGSWIELNDVLYLKGAPNLLSVRILVSKETEVIFKKDKCFIYIADKLIVETEANNPSVVIFKVPQNIKKAETEVEEEFESKTSTDEKKLLKHLRENHTPYLKGCKGCALGKMQRQR